MSAAPALGTTVLEGAEELVLSSSRGLWPRSEAPGDHVELLARRFDSSALRVLLLLEGLGVGVTACVRKLKAFLHDRLGDRAEAGETALVPVAVARLRDAVDLGKADDVAQDMRPGSQTRLVHLILELETLVGISWSLIEQ